MDMEVAVGEGRNNATGTRAVVRGGRTGDLIVSQLQGRYFEQLRNGRTYNASNQTAQAISVALSTTYTGTLLYNPIGSNFILIPLKWKFSLSVAPAAIAPIGLLSGYSGTGGVTAQTTALITKTNQIGNPTTAVGVALSAATIVTPTYLFHLWDGFTAAALPAPQDPMDFEGLFGILPGGFIGFSALTAVTGFGSMTWVEVELPLL